MKANTRKHKLRAENPAAIVVGDGAVDSHIYDMRLENADQGQGWTTPLSRDDWHYAEGFDTRQCLAGAAAIHAMLSANGIQVAGNTFPVETAFLKPQTGSTFVLRQRSNAGKTEKDRTRAYLMKTKKGTWSQILAAGRDPAVRTSNKNPLAAASVDRDKTWRVAVKLLCKSGVDYFDPFEKSKHKFEKKALRAICLWDIARGSFLAPTAGAKWKRQQDELFAWYKTLCNGKRKPAILIRTSDPDRFARFLERLGAELDETPTVILVCALAHIGDGDLRGSGTWSGIWAQAYDHLNEKKKAYLLDSTGNDWRFHIVVPVYEDGVIWIGPGCWPISEGDRTDSFLRDDRRPIGRIFMIPGTQPGLSEFEEHSRVIGVHALMTYTVVEHLANAAVGSELASTIMKALMRARRLRSHGYCTPNELFLIPDSGKKLYINYPCELWKKGLRAATDSLLDIENVRSDIAQEHFQRAGPYEAICRVDRDEVARTSAQPRRIFRTIEKVISNEFVGSPRNCHRVIQDVRQEKDILDGLKHEKIDHWIKTKTDDQLLPLDTFAKEEIESFTLRQRISMQFGNFAMADPREAARILDLAQRVREHVRINRHKEPDKGKVFNFALFGSPGSGKSFLAREIQRLIDPKGEIFTPDEFNISQFTEPAQFTRALEGVASKSVGGKVPLVLWDEFDSVLDDRRGGWLSRFLMPMQDAHFFDGRQRRPIGTAVFVFIGGTFPTADDFRDWACRTTKRNEAPSEAVLLKARDFHSRLYTALDMPSIIESYTSEGIQYQKFTTTWPNSYSKLARAVLLRKYFRDNCKIGATVFLKGVRDDLCRFLLAIPLRHGARSLERIVEACVVSKPSHVSMLHLPPDEFLEEHIETKHVHRDGKLGEMSIREMREACRKPTPAVRPSP